MYTVVYFLGILNVWEEEVEKRKTFNSNSLGDIKKFRDNDF